MANGPCQYYAVLCCAMCACARHAPVCIGRLFVRMRMIVGGRGCLNSSGGRMLHAFFLWWWLLSWVYLPYQGKRHAALVVGGVVGNWRSNIS